MSRAPEPAPLRLIAEDAEDLKTIAAALQDAVGRIGDIRYDPAARTLTIALNRYRWEAGARRGERVRTALQLGGVMSVRARKLRQGVADAVLALLDVGFEAGEAPGGTVAFIFAGGGDLRCEVECIDAALADVSGAWPARRTPEHGEA
ncbi:MAG TPA: DUF2948 family protein [Caulobacteraceae bacterium]|jgi:hypothetical protein|nr:DUF2948 family protein [Caulobacteraceae bacterium]